MEEKNERLVGNVSIENLTVHFGNNNFYAGDPWDPCDYLEECDDEGRSTDDTDNVIALNRERVSEAVARETKVPLETVSKVINSETSILKKLGIVEIGKENEGAPAGDGAVKHEKAKHEKSAEDTEDDAGKDSDEDISDEEVESFLNEVFGELIPSIAGKKSSGRNHPIGRTNMPTVRWDVKVTRHQGIQNEQKGDDHGNEN